MEELQQGRDPLVGRHLVTALQEPADPTSEVRLGALGLSRRDFVAQHTEQEDGWTILRLGEPQCQFLTEDSRCSIYPVRPKQCATWPFWEENLKQENWEGSVSDICPGIGKGTLHSAEEMERPARETEEWYE